MERSDCFFKYTRRRLGTIRRIGVHAIGEDLKHIEAAKKVVSMEAAGIGEQIEREGTRQWQKTAPHWVIAGEDGAPDGGKVVRRPGEVDGVDRRREELVIGDLAVFELGFERI